MSKFSPIQTPVAIIGMGCIFAKSPDLKSYWHLLSSGINGISDPPPTHAQLSKYLDPDPKRDDHIYTNRGGFIPATDFDPTEFGIPPNSLEATDTSQLLGLITAQKALEDAGYGINGKAFDRGNTSVILGITGTQELVIPLGSRLGHPLWRDAMQKAGVSPETADNIVHDISDQYVPWQENSFPGLLGNVVAGRIANRLDLGGTNCVVDAACASSMGAIHMALMELETHRSDMIVSGGVDTINDIFMHMCFAKTHILSSKGNIKPFSEEADGTLLGEGVGLLVLKRLDDAQRDGDRIYAVIKGIGSGSDGKSQSIYAPRPDGQAQALQRAYTRAGVDPGQVGLVEAHGTGTRVGDGVEFQALCQTFANRKTNKTQNFCALGAVKSNIGHTKAAAGTAGLMKAALSLYHKNLPPTLNADPVDPKLNVSESPFYINQTLRPWVQPGKQKRIAGVSAFGFGGSNFHVVLEEDQNSKSLPSWGGDIDIVAFSNDTKQDLLDQVNKWHDSVLACENKKEIRALSHSTRSRFLSTDTYRLLFVLPEEMNNALIEQYYESGIGQINSGVVSHTSLRGSIFYGEAATSGGLAFLFPGQGSQYVGMGRRIVCSFPSSLHTFEDAVASFDGNPPLDEYVYPRIIGDPKVHEFKLRSTDIAQPAIGAVSCAMIQALHYFDIRPDATCGHSYGELVALYAAGWISQSDLWRLSITRGRLMAAASQKSQAKGGMLAVMAPIEELQLAIKLDDNLNEKVVLANLNGPNQGILSGTESAIEQTDRLCRDKGWKTVLLPVSGAFHSPQMSDAVIPFTSLLDEIDFTPTQIPVMSNALGDRYPADATGIRTALGGQLTQPVNFISNIEKLYEQGIHTFIEVGPKSILTGLVHTILADRQFNALALDASGGRRSDETRDLAKTICALGALGYPVAVDRWEDSTDEHQRKMRMKIPLSGANYKSPKTAIEKKKDNGSNSLAQLNGTIKNKNADLSKNSSTAIMDAPIRANGQTYADDIQQTKPSGPAKENNSHDSAPFIKGNGHVSKMTTYGNDFLKQSILAVQQGLSTMQSLQAQTTQAHQKFLEGQVEANRSLADMVQSVQNLILNNTDPTSSAYNFSSKINVKKDNYTEPQKSISEVAQPIKDSYQPEVKQHSNPVDIQMQSKPLENGIAQTKTNGADANEPRSAIEKSITTIVSELTGYPEQMLGMEMDIESDLGIDSIKRVEILSAVEEQMPDLPKVTPEMLGELKTLGQICDYLSSSSTNEAENHQTEPSTDNPTAVGDDDIRMALVAIVSDLTGYPEEMLGMDMDIESDLGIDSIKRVEILSAVEEQMPDLPKVTPEMLGELKTLGQICDYLSSSGTNGAVNHQTTPPADNPTTVDGDQQIQKALVAIVSDLTGYPEEMLGMDMDIESDLGIDSIKRVEILSAVEERMPDLPKVTPEMLGELKTLGQICAYLAGSKNSNVNPSKPLNDGQHILADVEENGHILDRFVVEPVQLKPLESTKFVQAEDTTHTVVVAEDTELAQILIADLHKSGFSVTIHPPEPPADFDDKTGCVILLSPVSPKQAFLWAKLAAPILQRRSDQGRRSLFCSISFLDGAFGFANGIIESPMQGALAGLVKTAALEWPNVICRAYDIDPNWKDLHSIAKIISTEILYADASDPIEIGLTEDSRLGLRLVPGTPSPPAPIELNSDHVVVVTGGARGVTATAAKFLAKSTGCRLALVGRSDEPKDEPEWLTGLTTQSEIKKAIYNHLSMDGQPTPKDVEQLFRYWMTNREILNTLNELHHDGIRNRYFSVDVRDAASVSIVFEQIRTAMGPIKGVIHGAGILKDRLIEEKTPEQFDLVFKTKVDGLASILQATDLNDLRYLILFSSISGRLGNIGQADYAMANEVLNKTASQLSAQNHHCNIISINWGPWNGGMVTEELKRHFNKKGISLIEPDLGAKAMVAEMKSATKSPTEIIIGGLLSEKKTESNVRPLPSKQKNAGLINEQPLNFTAKRQIVLKQFPILESHYLDGRPVVPLALITEWLAHGALHANPGLRLHGIDNLRLFKGIFLESDEKNISILASTPKCNGPLYEVNVEIHDADKALSHPIHSSATAILADCLPSPPNFIENGHFKAVTLERSLEDYYRNVLFHGDALKGLRNIIRLSEEGMTAIVKTAPAPKTWIRNPWRSRWLADPLVLDSSFQMAIIWCYEQLGLLSLPSYISHYRQYCDRFPTEGVTVVFEVTATTPNKITGKFTFLGDDKKVLAILNGFEAIMDQNLHKAFGVKAA